MSGGHKRSRGQETQPKKWIATWCFPAIGRSRELVWLRATRSQHVGVKRITHQAAKTARATPASPRHTR
jgi:hypothetical protein